MAAVLLGFASLAVTSVLLCKQFLPGTFQRIQQKLPGRLRRSQAITAAVQLESEPSAVFSLRYPNSDGFTAPACEIYARARSSLLLNNASAEVQDDGTITQVQTQAADTDDKRLIAVGDIHGSLEGLLGEF
jgi:hypothetical protein